MKALEQKLLGLHFIRYYKTGLISMPLAFQCNITCKNWLIDEPDTQKSKKIFFFAPGPSIFEISKNNKNMLDMQYTCL